MKTVFLLACLVAVALAGVVPHEETYEAHSVDADFVLRQKKVFSLFKHVTQIDENEEYYKIGSQYDIEANVEHYTNKKYVEDFVFFYKHGLVPWAYEFSIFHDKMREQAIALIHLFYSAKDFETFYKTAAWARVHVNTGMFIYSYTVALKHREDTKAFVLPAPYEVYPYFFVNSEVIHKLQGIKMLDNEVDTELAQTYGIVKKDNVFTVTANYTGWANYDNEEQKISYFTEDVGLNSFYFYNHVYMPFWMKGEWFGPLKERRGEVSFYVYQQLLARYYLERLTNGLGEIPQLSWEFPVKTGYTPNMINHAATPFVHRNNYYHIQHEKNFEALKYLESFENQFLEYLEQGHFKSHDVEVDFKNGKSINFVGNYWLAKHDVFRKHENFHQYYEVIARYLLGAVPEFYQQYGLEPFALGQYQTSLRDPVFFQLYKRIINYFIQAKQYLEPYTKEQLHFNGVKINDVHVDKLETFFDYFEFNATNALYFGKNYLQKTPYSYMVRQPRLNHKNFNIKFDVKSDVATDAVFKVFLAPKYDKLGNHIELEDNWMNFVELDQFVQKLTPGENTITRNSEDFYFYTHDAMTSAQLLKWFDSGKVPVEKPFHLPGRLMLPKGTKGGYPFQIFVFAYPYEALDKEFEPFKEYIIDNKPFGYPFDRPVNEYFFWQPNMFFEDVAIYHDGEENVNKFGYYGYEHALNTVNKNY